MAKDSFTFHVVGLPHTQTTKEYISCAYTEKVRKFCNMMKSLGHTVYLYASEENEASVDELITIAPKEDQRKWFGDYDHKQKFYQITWDPNDIHWRLANERAIKEIKARAGERDFVCLIAGNCQKQIADALPKLMSVEFGIGYSGTFSPYRVFESYAWMHYNYGKDGSGGKYFDTVIPNYWELDAFDIQEENPEKEPYFLFVGRMIRNKGADLAAEISNRTGTPLILAGQGVNKQFRDKDGVTHIYADEVRLAGSKLLHIGSVDEPTRNRLMKYAKAVFVPTTYVEPFGGVHVEAMLNGTPVITTDWGVFTETVIDGVNGYRTRTIGEALWAAENVDKLDREQIKAMAEANYGADRVKYMYQAYFEQLSLLWDKGYSDDQWHRGIAEYARYKRKLN